MVDDTGLAGHDAWIGEVLGGRYELTECIGSGGMGLVFAARHIELERLLAVKLLKAQYSRDGVWVERFRREARAATAIGHENIIDITDIGAAADGSMYYVMELLSGETLSATLEREGPMPWTRVRGIARQLCEALAAAHHAGIVHRDLKLHNIFRLTRHHNPDFIKILDFGIAKTIAWGDASKLTATGETFGTPGYMAPEQICGGEVDARTDVYAVGVILYQLLSGNKPFQGATPEAIARRQFTQEPPPLAPYGVPGPIESAIRAALAPDPDRRPENMERLSVILTGVAELPLPPRDTREDREPTATTRSPEPATVRNRGAERTSRWLLVVPSLLPVIAFFVLASRYIGAESELKAPPPDPLPVAVATPPPPPTPEATSQIPPADAEPPAIVSAPEAFGPEPATPTPLDASSTREPVGASIGRTDRPIAETLTARLERHWPAIQSCLCDHYSGFPPASITVKMRVDPRTSRLAASLQSVGARAQTCADNALARSRALKLAAGAATTDTTVKRLKCT